MTDPDDPAFNSLPGSASPGLTKREYFAAQALTGLIIFDSMRHDQEHGDVESLAQRCLMVADALIAELNKPK